MDLETKKALLACIPVIIGVIATGILGAWLSYLWNLELKRREADLAVVKSFYELYGEFFAVWKLWNYYVRDLGPESFPDASRWEIMERAATAEGRMEAILIHLSSKYRSEMIVTDYIGKFRQIYQQLREAIRDNLALEWDYSEHPAYLEFKRLAPVIGYLIRTGREVTGDRLEQHTNAWIAATSNKYENYWKRPNALQR